MERILFLFLSCQTDIVYSLDLLVILFEIQQKRKLDINKVENHKTACLLLIKKNQGKTNMISTYIL